MYKKQLTYLVVIATLTRLCTAYMLELGNDEVYYYTYALHLQSNYFDHPPGVGLLIRLFTFNLTLTSEVFVRLGSIVFAAIGTLLCYQIGSQIANARTGWYAALLYNTSIYSAVIAGTFILPDSPQVVFWLGSLTVMIELVKKDRYAAKTPISTWLLFGLLSGLCIMCKVHGIFLWAGLGLYTVLFNRKPLTSPGVYLAALITVVVISPIFFWNLHNDFVTWRFHSERVEVKQFSLDTDSFLQTIFGQLFYNNPVNVIITLTALFYSNKRRLMRKNYSRLLLLTGLPIILFTTGISLFKSVLPHWSGPGFVTLLFIAAAYLDAKTPVFNKYLIHWSLKLATGLLLVIIIGGIACIKLYPGTIGNNETEKLGELDFTLDLTGWRQFSEAFRPWLLQQQQQGKLPADIVFADHKWFPAAHVDYYVAKPLHTIVYGVGKVNDLHQYVWLNHERKLLAKGGDALCIVASNYPDNPAVTYAATFASTQLLQSFAQTRNGRLVRYFKVYMLKGYKGGDEAEGFAIGQ